MFWLRNKKKISYAFLSGGLGTNSADLKKQSDQGLRYLLFYHAFVNSSILFKNRKRKVFEILEQLPESELWKWTLTSCIDIDMDVTSKLCFVCVLFTLIHGRIIYSKKNKVKKSQKEEQWLVDSVSLSPQSWADPEGGGAESPDPPP